MGNDVTLAKAHQVLLWMCVYKPVSKQGCFFSSSMEAICHHLVQLKATCVQAEYYNTLFPIFSSSKWQWGHFFLVKLPLQQLFVLVSPTVWRLQINNGFFVTLSVSIDICKSFQMIISYFPYDRYIAQVFLKLLPRISILNSINW